MVDGLQNSEVFLGVYMVMLRLRVWVLDLMVGAPSCCSPEGGGQGRKSICEGYCHVVLAAELEGIHS